MLIQICVHKWFIKPKNTDAIKFLFFYLDISISAVTPVLLSLDHGEMLRAQAVEGHCGLGDQGLPFTSHATLGKPLTFLNYLICMVKLQIGKINRHN